MASCKFPQLDDLLILSSGPQHGLYISVAEGVSVRFPAESSDDTEVILGQYGRPLVRSSVTSGYKTITTV